MDEQNHFPFVLTDEFRKLWEAANQTYVGWEDLDKFNLPVGANKSGKHSPHFDDMLECAYHFAPTHHIPMAKLHGSLPLTIWIKRLFYLKHKAALGRWNTRHLQHFMSLAN